MKKQIIRCGWRQWFVSFSLVAQRPSLQEKQKTGKVEKVLERAPLNPFLLTEIYDKKDSISSNWFISLALEDGFGLVFTDLSLHVRLFQ